MTKRLLCSLCAPLMMTLAFAQNMNEETHIDLPGMFEQIDEAIDYAPRYIAEYEKKIADMRQVLDQDSNDEQRFFQLMELSQMYESFNGDSTQVYTERALEVAQKGGFKEMEGLCVSRLAYLCTFLGSQTEALTLLRRLDADSLSQEARGIYYRAFMMVYSNLSSNTQLEGMRQEFTSLYNQSMDSLLSVLPEGSELYYRHVEPMLIAEGKLEEALKVNDKRLNMVQDGTHENAIVAYSRYQIYSAMGDMEKATYWLCKSALDDVRNAVMDQMSLITLGELLDSQGDAERASRYISFTWDCNRRFSPHLRSWQIAPLLSAIEKNYQSKFNKRSYILTIWGVVATLLMLVTGIGFYVAHKQRKRLRVAESELSEANAELEKSNRNLKQMNDRLMKHNKDLFDANKALTEKQGAASS